MAARRLDVDVDVWKARAFGAQKALKEQFVLNRVNPADAEQVVHERTCARAAGCDSNVHVANHLRHIGNGQKVGREFELVYGDQFLAEPVLYLAEHGLASARIAPVHARFCLLPEHLEGVSVDSQCRLLGGLGLHPAAVANRVESAAIGQFLGVLQELGGAISVFADLFGESTHQGGWL